MSAADPPKPAPADFFDVIQALREQLRQAAEAVEWLEASHDQDILERTIALEKDALALRSGAVLHGDLEPEAINQFLSMRISTPPETPPSHSRAASRTSDASSPGSSRAASRAASRNSSAVSARVMQLRPCSGDSGDFDEMAAQAAISSKSGDSGDFEQALIATESLQHGASSASALGMGMKRGQAISLCTYPSDGGGGAVRPTRRTVPLVLRGIWNELTEEELQTCMPGFHPDVRLQPPGSTDTGPHVPLARARRNQTNLTFASSSSGYQCMLDPNKPFRLLWSIPAIMFVAYDTIMVPLQAFHEFIDDNRAIYATELLIAIFWTIDIAVSFRTGFYQGTTLEMRPHKVAQEYARSWLAPDITLVLLEWIGQFVGTMSSVSLARVTRALRVVRCARLLRLVKLPNVWRLFEDQINSNLLHLFFDVFKTILAFLVCLHAITCAWYAIGAGDSTGWITYDRAAQQDGSFTFWYFASSRWVLAQINGRTDLNERRNMQERLFTCVVSVCFAVVFMSIFLSSITATVLKLSEISAKHNHLRRSVNEFLQSHRVSVVLVAGVKRQMLANASIKAMLDDQEREKQVLALLPEHLQYDLLYEIRAPVLAWHAFFREVDVGFARVVRHLCLTAMRAVLAHTKQDVFEHGDPCSRMLFVDKGRLVYIQYNHSLEPSSRSVFQQQGPQQSRKVSISSNDSALGTSSQVSGGLCEATGLLPQASAQLESQPKPPVSHTQSLALCSQSTIRSRTRSSTRETPGGQRKYAREGEEKCLECKIRPGMWLSEGALWMDWENQGRLVADTDCTLMALHAQDLGQTLLAYRDAYAMSVLYARSFLEALKVQGQPSDLAKISLFFDTRAS